MAEEEVTAPENESETADQEVDSSALEAAVDQAVEADQGGVGGAKEEEMTVQNVRQDLHLGWLPLPTWPPY